MSNKEIKALLHNENVYMWQVAKVLGVHETVFCKWFREPLSQEQIQRILSAVEEIRKQKKGQQE